MKTLLTTLTLVAVFTVFSPQLSAAEVEVLWQNPDKYRDVDAGEGHRAKFKENTFSQLEKHFAKLAEKLPEDYILKIKVNDLDLAGDVHLGGIRQIRVVKNIYFPRIQFSYQLISADQKILSENEINLKDMGFMMHNSLKYNNSSLAYEKKMLDDWFEDTFSDYISK